LAYKRVFNGYAILDAMTAKLQQRQKRNVSVLGPRICDPQQPGTSASTPPLNASNNPHRLGLRWQSAATTPLSPAPQASNHSRYNRPHHSPFYWQAELRHSSFAPYPPSICV